MSNSQLKKSKSGIRNGTKVTLNLSSNVIANSNNENYFLHKLLLPGTQVSRLHKAFANGSSVHITLAKTQLSKMADFLGRLLGPLLKACFLLTKIILKPLVKTILILLGLTAAP